MCANSSPGSGSGWVRLVARCTVASPPIRHWVREVLPRDTFEGLATGNPIERRCIGGIVEIARDVVEGSVFQHENDDVIDLVQVSRHVVALREAGNGEKLDEEIVRGDDSHDILCSREK